MDSPLARMILTVFGGYLLILLGLAAVQFEVRSFILSFSRGNVAQGSGVQPR